LPTLDHAVPVKPTVAENHATAIILILNRAASAPPVDATSRAFESAVCLVWKLDSVLLPRPPHATGKAPVSLRSAESDTPLLKEPRR